MIVLGCITTNLRTAVRLAAVLSRSLVQINIRTTLPDIETSASCVAPFEILVIKDSQSEDSQALAIDKLNLASAVTWLKSHDTHRYWHVSEDTYTRSSSNKLFDNVDCLLESLNDLGVNRACHFRLQDNGTFQAGNICSEGSAQTQQTQQTQETQETQETERTEKTDSAINTENLNRCGVVYLTQGENSLNELVTEIEELEISHHSFLRHVIIARPPQLNSNNIGPIEWITAIRGSERYALVTGPVAAGEHLPAMLRIRGWLNSSHQAPQMDISADDPTLIIDDQADEHAAHAYWVKHSDWIERLDNGLLNTVTLVIRQNNGLAAISVLQKTDTENGLFSVAAAKVDNSHPFSALYSIE